MLKIGFWITAVLSGLMGLIYSAIYWLPALGSLMGSDLSRLQRFIDRGWAAAWPWSLAVPGLCVAIGVTWLIWNFAQKRQDEEPEPGERRKQPSTIQLRDGSGFDQILADSNREVERPRAVRTELPSWATETQPGVSTDNAMTPAGTHLFGQMEAAAPQLAVEPPAQVELPVAPELQHEVERPPADPVELPVLTGEIEAVDDFHSVEPQETEEEASADPDHSWEGEPFDVSPEPAIPGIEEVQRFLADRSTLADMGGWVESLVDEVQDPFERAIAEGSFDVGVDPNVARIMYLRMVAAIAEKRMGDAQKTAFINGVHPEVVDLVLAKQS